MGDTEIKDFEDENQGEEKEEENEEDKVVCICIDTDMACIKPMNTHSSLASLPAT